MLPIGLLSALAGMALAQRCKVLVLAPAILLVLLGAAGFAIAKPDAVSDIGLRAVAAILGLQTGYLFGLGIRHLVLVARASRRRSTPLSGSLSPQHRGGEAHPPPARG